MPASYRIDLRAGVVFTLVEGHVTNEDYWPTSSEWLRTPTSCQR